MATNRSITSDRFPYLPIRVRIRGWEVEDTALLDTGYTGELIIPRHILPHDLGLPEAFMNVGLGDDQTVVPSPLYYGAGEIIGLPSIPDLSITVIGDEFVIGVGIIWRYRILLDYGERIIVEL